MSKPVESITISEEDAEVWSDEEQCFVLNAPSNFYILNSLGQRVFYRTRNRAEAQQAADEEYGKGRYTIRVVKDQKTKSKLESGLLSCYGTATRKGQKKYN